jgi:hypothetical protein
MFIWQRVFGILEDEPTPAELCQELERQGLQVRPAFRGDDQGWFAARLELVGQAAAVQIERYLVREERMRGDLNSWCAWLEGLPNTAEREAVLDALVATTQIFTLYEDAADEESISEVCPKLATWLAVRLQGIYQIDGQGFFDASGRLIVKEAPQPTAK